MRNVKLIKKLTFSKKSVAWFSQFYPTNGFKVSKPFKLLQIPLTGAFWPIYSNFVDKHVQFLYDMSNGAVKVKWTAKNKCVVHNFIVRKTWNWKWVILVNMVISVILGHEKTKIQNIIDLEMIDVFSVKTIIHSNNKKMGHLIWPLGV